MITSNEPQQPITLVLEGGGMRFPAFVGALRALEEKGLSIEKVVGSGFGSLVGCLYASGMPPGEMQRAVVEVNPAVFGDFTPGNFRRGKGLYEGRLLEEWVDGALKGATFGTQWPIAPQVVATDILNYKPVIFTAADYPDIRISAAVRYSVGMPWIFTHKRVTLKGQEHVLIDGSLMAGAVAKMLEREGRKTLVLKVVSKRTLTSLVPGELNFRKYFLETLNFSLHALEKEFIKGGKWHDTILLYCGDIAPAKFNLSLHEKRYLLEQGYEQTLKYLEYKWGI